MKIALVQGPYREAVYETISMPLGLCWISAYLKAKIDDIAIEGFDLLLRPQLEAELYRRVAEDEFDIVGIQAHSDMTLLEVVRIINKIKELNPRVKVFAGGNAATYLSAVLFRSSDVDIIIKGEGEITFCELVRAMRKGGDIKEIKGILFREGSEIRENEDRPLMENLDELPLPDRSIFDRFPYPQYGVMMSRGCPYHCSFCSTSAFWKNRVRFRSPDSVMRELVKLKEDYKINKLFILDDSFGINKDGCKEFLMALSRAPFRIEWACVTRADVMDYELLDWCRKAGCVEIHFGLDSANAKTQRLINKNLDIGILEQRCCYAQKIGIRTKLSIILGLPGETEEDIGRTIDLLHRIRPNEIQIYPLMPYVGTALFDEGRDTGVYLLEQDFSKWKQDVFQPVVQSELLTRDDIVHIAEKAVQSFRKEGYKCIPFDMEPVKKNEKYIVKTLFAPLQAL